MSLRKLALQGGEELGEVRGDRRLVRVIQNFHTKIILKMIENVIEGCSDPAPMTPTEGDDTVVRTGQKPVPLWGNPRPLGRGRRSDEVTSIYFLIFPSLAEIFLRK